MRRRPWLLRRMLGAPPLPSHAYPPVAVAMPSGAAGAAPDVAADRAPELVLDGDDLVVEPGADAAIEGGAGEFELPGSGALVDVVAHPPSPMPSYGTRSSFTNPKTTSDRCTGGKTLACPVLVGLVELQRLDGIGFEYIGGFDKKPGLVLDRAGRWQVVEKHRQRDRKVKITQRGAAGVASFIAAMRAAGLELEAILTMGSIYCRCIKGTATLSDHSYGDAMDIGGFRLVGGPEVLVSNFDRDPAARKLLHRANACLRLSFARVLDYHYKGHDNHFHCDTNRGGARAMGPGWAFVRESLGLPLAGGFNKACANALRQLGGAGAVKDPASLNRTLATLFMREARRS